MVYSRVERLPPISPLPFCCPCLPFAGVRKWEGERVRVRGRGGERVRGRGGERVRGLEGEGITGWESEDERVRGWGGYRARERGVRGWGLRSDVHVVVRMWRVSAKEKRKWHVTTSIGYSAQVAYTHPLAATSTQRLKLNYSNYLMMNVFR